MRAGIRLGMAATLAGIVLIGVNDSLQTASAEGDTRTLSFRHLHTQETITVTFKRDGRYDDAALKKLDWFMRDWRKEQSVRMDPHLFDVLWEAYRDVGGKKPIEVICGYRAPGTNAMLRARSSGVAQNSNHITGKAIDFAIPGVDLAKLREVGLRMQRGGVGFYPTSGSPFVHLDTGSIRHWPRMTHDQLVKVFPDGRTVHVPSDGQPLSGYALALADVEARGKEPSGVSLAAARDAGVVTASAERSAKPKRGLLASLFRANLDESDDDEQATPKPVAKPVAVASLSAASKPKPVAVQSIVPMPAQRPKPVTLAMAVTGANTIDNRSPWQAAIEASALPPLTVAASPASKPPFAPAEADPEATGTAGTQAFAFAGEAASPRPAQARPMGERVSERVPAVAPVMPDSARVAVAFAGSFASELIGGAQRGDSPWLRAAILTPSFSEFLTATYMGELHMRPLVALLQKPAQALVMTFSDDPHLGLRTDSFAGHAVVFLATATFARQQTASLR